MPNLIEKVVKKRNITIYYLSKQIHVDRKTIRDWENNTKQPSIAHLNELSKILEVDPLNLMGAIEITRDPNKMRNLLDKLDMDQVIKDSLNELIIENMNNVMAVIYFELIETPKARKSVFKGVAEAITVLAIIICISAVLASIKSKTEYSAFENAEFVFVGRQERCMSLTDCLFYIEKIYKGEYNNNYIIVNLNGFIIDPERTYLIYLNESNWLISAKILK